MTLERVRVAVDTNGRGFFEVTRLASDAVRASNILDGMCNVFLEHTSASLILCENADRDVRRDLESFVQRLVPDGDPSYAHSAEGPDDMPAHVRSVLTLASITIPVGCGKLQLGTWQGLYLWEHRIQPHRRWLTLSIWG